MFTIDIRNLFSWFNYGLVYLDSTKKRVLFLFIFQMKTQKFRTYSNYADFGCFHCTVVNNSGLVFPYSIFPKRTFEGPPLKKSNWNHSQQENGNDLWKQVNKRNY